MHTALFANCTVLTCSCTYTQSAQYWTSTSGQADIGGAWYVGFHDGRVARTGIGSTTLLHVRAVRGGF